MRYIFGFCLAAAAASPCAAQNENRAGKLFAAEGFVQYLKAGSIAWTTVTSSKLIEAGDKVRTGSGSKAEVSLNDGAKISLGADSVLVLALLTPKENSMEMIAGKMQVSVRRMSDRKFITRTLSALCETSEAVFEVEVDSAGLTAVNVVSGTVQVSDSGNTAITLTPNKQVSVSHDNGLQQPPPAVVDPATVQDSVVIYRGSTP